MEERRARVRALFDEAAELGAGEREAFLQAACAGDPDLRAEVEGLLACDDALLAGEGGDDFLNSPLLRSAAEALEALAGPGLNAPRLSHVGHYRILRELGSGGMGSVFEAEQDNPRRAVALKVIRAGLASPGLVKRFAHEAQILGRLHHPGIAQIYEAGLTEEGQPYFAMELITGIGLDRHVRQPGWDVAARLGLFARVCDAVQHAHDKGVIHRDLKPGNILVDETGQPKVLDFGVARATNADVQTATGLTEVGQLVGTLNYMSPEQIAADPALIDQRSDVYALGVILFELLADRLPYHLAGLPLPEAARVIRDKDPSSLGSINTLLRGDVETIVAKALEKDRSRRYPSAGEMASDIRHHLNHEPIGARPASATYLLRKFARRHKALVSSVAGIMAALVLGLVGTMLFAVREAEQRNQAEHNAQAALDEKHAALRQAYRARLAAAAAALQNHDVADAANQLAEAPAPLRDWEWHHLHSQLDDSSDRIVAEPGATLFLLHRPDGIQIGQVIPGTGLRLTDLDGRHPRTIAFNGKAESTGQIVQTNAGVRFLEWGKNDAFHLWDESALPRLSMLVTASARLSPDGSCLAQITRATVGGSEDVALYDTASSKRTALCVAHQARIWALAFSRDSSRLASVDENGLVCLWSSKTGAKTAAWRGHTTKILALAFRPDGGRLATTSADGTVRQWDPATGQPVETPYDRHTREIRAVAYSPDGEWIASGGADRTIRVWRATGRQDFAVLHGHKGDVTEVAFTPDGKRLASLSQEQQQGVNGVGDNTVGVWDVDFRASLPVLRGHTTYVYPAAFSPDGRWIASGSWDHTVRLWDAATGEPCATLSHADTVWALAFSPQGHWLATAGIHDDRLRLWKIETARVQQEIRGPGNRFRFLAITPDGSRMAATAHDEQKGFYWGVYDVASSKRLLSADGAALAYSPDGRWLASRTGEGSTVVLRDARTHEVVARFSGHEALIHWAAFSPDSRRLATCGMDRTVRLWTIDGGACQVLRGHTDEVFALAFHSGGTRLASGGRDGAVWLWDLASGEAVIRLQGHTSYVWSLAFSPDGKTLVSGSGDSTVRLWDTEPLAKRYQARREAEALRPEAERRVQELFRQKKDLADVAALLLADRALSEPLRHAALRAVQRLSARIAEAGD